MAIAVGLRDGVECAVADQAGDCNAKGGNSLHQDICKEWRVQVMDIRANRFVPQVFHRVLFVSVIAWTH